MLGAFNEKSFRTLDRYSLEGEVININLMHSGDTDTDVRVTKNAW